MLQYMEIIVWVYLRNPPIRVLFNLLYFTSTGTYLWI